MPSVVFDYQTTVTFVGVFVCFVYSYWRSLFVLPIVRPRVQAHQTDTGKCLPSQFSQTAANSNAACLRRPFGSDAKVL